MNMKISFLCHGTDLARTATVVRMVLATVWGEKETLQLSMYAKRQACVCVCLQQENNNIITDNIRMKSENNLGEMLHYERKQEKKK